MKKQQKININNLLLYISNILFFLIFLFTIFGVNKFVSILFSLTFIVTFILYLKNILKSFNKTDFITIIIIVLTFLNVIVNMLFYNQIGFDYLKKSIIFLFTIMHFNFMVKISINKERFVSFLKILFIFLAVSCVLLYFFKNSDMYIFNGKVSNYLCFNFGNPNETALFMSTLFLLGTSLIGFNNKFIHKLVYFGLLILIAFFIFETKSRNSLIAIIIYSIFLIFTIFKKRKINFNKSFILIGISWPIIYFSLYMIFIDKIKTIFSFLESEGKTLDSRLYIWKYAIENFAKSPIIGAYSQINNGYGTSQLFNTHLDVMVSYGFIVFLLFLYYLYRLVQCVNLKCKSVQSKVCLLSFVAAIMLGMNEAALVSGGLAIHIFIGNFLLLACDDELIVKTNN